MGYTNPNRFSLNFVGMLSSQQDPNNLESRFSFSLPIQMSSSQIPQYSTQNSDAQNLDENSREARRRWTPSEVLVLISAWLNTSKDPIVGNEQKANAFWERITAYYAESRAVAGKPKRGLNQCKMRWKKINESVSKFVGCYRQVSSRRSSGQSEDDVLQMVYELYFKDHQVKFSLEHAWLELRNDKKWSTSSQCSDRSKRTKLDEGCAYSSSSNTTSHAEEEASRRPPGVKASKGKAKKSGTTEESEASSLVKFERLSEMKEKDTAARDILSKQHLLDSFIAKTEFSEPKLNLKNKLIAEILG